MPPIGYKKGMGKKKSTGKPLPPPPRVAPLTRRSLLVITLGACGPRPGPQPVPPQVVPPDEAPLPPEPPPDTPGTGQDAGPPLAPPRDAGPPVGPAPVEERHPGAPQVPRRDPPRREPTPGERKIPPQVVRPEEDTFREPQVGDTP